MSELEDKLSIALANIETAKQIILHGKANEKDQEKVNLLANYNLELLDLKLRLKDMIKHLNKIEGD